MQITSTCCGVYGSLLFVFVALKLPMGQRRLRFLRPVTYLNILHPGNYFLLSNLFTLLCFLFWVFELNILGYLALLISGMIMQFHLSMAHQVYMITETPIFSPNENIMPENITNEPVVEKETMEEVEEVDVLIVGAGPTGLLLTSILGKNGISVMLVEVRPKPVDDARFTVVNSASMEILAKNLDPDLFKELRMRAIPDSNPYGSFLTTGLAHSDAKVLKVANSPSRKELMKDIGNICDVTESRILGSKHATELPIRAHQSHQEHVLKKQAERIDVVQLRYGHRLLGFKIQENNTIVEAKVCPCSDESLSSADQSLSFTVRSKYIVGSDGPNSTVAKGLGLNFDGFLNVGHNRSLLVRAPGLYENVLNRFGGTFMYQIIRKNFGFCGIVPSDPKNHLWHFLQIIGEETKRASSDKICREFLGTSNHEIVTDRNWYWNFFVAREWRKGPGFIAGDAAHSWPPLGALGGNTGYGDAANLAWKLASVCNGVGGEVLLDSYETERRQTTLMTALFTLSLLPRQDMMNKFIIPFADSPFIKQFLKGNYYYANSGKHLGNHFSQSGLQLGTKYNKSPIISSHQSLPDDPYCDYLPCIHGGARLPFFHIRSLEDSCVIVGVHDLIHSQSYTLFVVANNDHTNLGQHAQRAAVEALKINFKKVGVPLSVQEINTTKVGMIQENKSGTRATSLELWNDQLIILVRPDHVTAWHLSVEDAEDHSDNVESYLASNCQTVVATVTGLSPIDGSDLKIEFDESDDKMKMMSYQQWLTKQFRSHLRPYGFLFPKAVPIHNETKAQAMTRVKNKNKDKEYDFTTRVTAEKNKAPSNLKKIVNDSV